MATWPSVILIGQFILAFAELSFVPSRVGAVTLVENATWKVDFAGFVEADSIWDSTRSLLGLAGNSPIARPGTSLGDLGRLHFSMRNSRLSFSMQSLTPTLGSLTNLGYLELDFLGFDPQPVTNLNTEFSATTSPTPRIRHAYGRVTWASGWELLVGQTWTLFGWGPNTFLSTVSFAPVAGEVYERSPQIRLTKCLGSQNERHPELAMAILRPIQRDSGVPVVDLGARYVLPDWPLAYNLPTDLMVIRPSSFGISATFRDVAIPKPGVTQEQVHYPAGGLALDAVFPVMACRDALPHNCLSATVELSSGFALADLYTNWTGNLPQFALGATTPNLDAGFGGFNSQGQFQLVGLSSGNASLQYYFDTPQNPTYVSLGYAILSSQNAVHLQPAAGQVVYNQAETLFSQIVRQWEGAVRGALEFSLFRSHYSDGVYALNYRLMTTFYYRF